MKTEKQVLYLLIVGAILIVISPFILTRSLGIIEFTGTGEIGDTIGGITSPIASIIGSILVYYALKAQIDANAIIQKQLTDQKSADYERKIVDYLTNLLNIIREEINGFEYVETTTERSSNEGEKITETLIKGSDAIYKFLDLYLLVRYRDNNNHMDEIDHIKRLKYLLILIEKFLQNAIKEPISEKDKEYLISILRYIYETKIKLHFDFQKNSPESGLTYRKEDVEDELFIINNSINFLLDNQLAPIFHSISKINLPTKTYP